MPDRLPSKPDILQAHLLGVGFPADVGLRPLDPLEEAVQF